MPPVKPTNHQAGLDAEERVADLLRQEGWHILARRLRTDAGEIDLVVTRDDVLVFAEVKRRATLYAAAEALRPTQQARLFAAATIALATHPDWATTAIRFDVFVVDRAGAVRRIVDAFRQEN